MDGNDCRELLAPGRHSMYLIVDMLQRRNTFQGYDGYVRVVYYTWMVELSSKMQKLGIGRTQRETRRT